MGTKAIDTISNDIQFFAPCEHFEAVAPSDANELLHVARRLYIGVGGNLKVAGRGDLDTAPVTIVVVAGQVLEGYFRQVFATGTSATGIVAGY